MSAWLAGATMICGTAVPAFAEGIRIVVPNVATDTEGASSAPLSFQATGFRTQVTYSSTEFGDLPESYQFITEIAFRPNAFITSPRTVMLEDAQWYLSTSATAVDDRNVTFSENHGPNKTLVYDGPLTLSTDAIGPPEGPRSFDYRFALQTPFLYDPAQGNLVVEFSSSSGYTPALGDDQVVNSNQQLVDIPLSGSETGFFLSNGLILELTFVPEPSTLALGMGAFLALLTSWRRRW